MVEAELVIGRIRNQVRELHQLLNYLENCEVRRSEEYSYLGAKLHEAIVQLSQTRRFSSQHSGRIRLQANWLN